MRRKLVLLCLILVLFMPNIAHGFQVVTDAGGSGVNDTGSSGSGNGSGGEVKYQYLRGIHIIKFSLVEFKDNGLYEKTSYYVSWRWDYSTIYHLNVYNSLGNLGKEDILNKKEKILEYLKDNHNTI